MLVKKIKKTALQIACDRNNIKLIKSLIKIGVDVNEENFVGETALDIACRNGNTQVIDILLDAGAKIKLGNYQQLMRYLSKKQELDYKTMTLLFKELAKDHVITDDSGNTLLHLACKNNDIQAAIMLIDGNEVLNNQNKAGETPLHIACKNNNYKMVKLLLSAGCKLNISNHNGTTPLHIAFSNANYKIAKKLLECGANFDLKDNWGKSPLKIEISRQFQPLIILKYNILNLRLLCENYNFKGIESFLEKNNLNFYKILAVKFLMSSNSKENRKIDAFDIIQKNKLIRSIVKQTNILEALRWSINIDDFKVFHVILRSDSITLQDLTTRFGRDMTIIDLAYNVNHHAAEFLQAKKQLLEKNVGARNKPIQRINEQQPQKNTLPIQQEYQTKQTTCNKLKRFFGLN